MAVYTLMGIAKYFRDGDVACAWRDFHLVKVWEEATRGTTEETDFCSEIFFRVWKQHGAPEGSPTYGEQAFYCRDGLTTTNEERSQIIEDVVLDSLRNVNDVREHKIRINNVL